MVKTIGNGKQAPPNFQITIGAYPSNAISLAQEIKLLKSAIIYGDHVKLYSLTATMLLLQSEAKDYTLAQKIKLYQLVAPYLPIDDVQGTLDNVKLYKQLLHQKNKSKAVILFLKQGENVMNSGWNQISDIVRKMSKDSGFNELLNLINKGVLELHKFKRSTKPDSSVNFMAECIESAARSRYQGLEDTTAVPVDEIITEFVEGISSSISEKGSYPLFDDKTSELIKAGIQANMIQIPVNSIAKGKQVALAAHILEKLPSFEYLSFDEILSIRDELANPLIRFRSAMISYSEDIKSEHWDSDFAIDADKIFHRDVAPAVLEIEESIKSNKLISQALRSVSDKPLTVAASSGMGLMLSNFTDLPDAIAKSLGVGAAAAPIIYDVYNKWKEKNSETQRNMLYFYYGVKRKVKS